MTVLNKTRTGRLENSKLAEITTPGDFFVSGSDIVAMAREIREYRQRIAEPLGYSAEDREALLRMAEHLMQYGRTDTDGQEELLREIGAVALRTLTARQAAPAIPKEAAGVIARFNHVCNHHAGWLCDVLEQDVIRRDLFIATEYMTDCYNASLAFGHRPPRDKPIMPAAWYDIMSERLRQINVEGYTPEHDDAYGGGELAGAAVCYARHVSTRGWIYAENPAAYQDEGVPDDWPWAEEWWKPASPYRDLEKAGALILAEMERITARAAPVRECEMSKLTVKQLIKELRKMPPEALVIFKDHDHGEGEFNNYVRYVDDVTDEFSSSSYDSEVRTVAIRG